MNVVLYAYGPSAVLSDPHSQPFNTRSIMNLCHTSLLPVRIGAPHKALSCEWWKQDVSRHRLDSWGELLQVEMPALEGSVRHVFEAASVEQKQAILLASEPLINTHHNAFVQDGMLWSPECALLSKCKDNRQELKASWKPIDDVSVDVSMFDMPEVTPSVIVKAVAQDVAMLNPRCMANFTSDYTSCSKPHDSLLPLWKRAAQFAIMRYDAAAKLPKLSRLRLQLKPTMAEVPSVFASWNRSVYGSVTEAEKDETPTHVVNGGSFHQKMDQYGSKVVATAVPPMSIAFATRQIPGIVWKSQKALLVQHPSLDTHGKNAVIKFENLPVKDKFAQSLVSLPKDADVRIQRNLLKDHKHVGWVQVDPNGFWMLMNQDGDFAPLPSFGVRLVPVKPTKQGKKYRSDIMIQHSQRVIGVLPQNQDIFVVNGSHLFDSHEDVVDFWPDVRRLALNNTPTNCLGFVLLS